MSCEALGQCRMCSRKHKIAVFGVEKAPHLFNEVAKLKLIILNTVCVVCIEKIKCFVTKMDLDMVFNDYIKHEDHRAEGNPQPEVSDDNNSPIEQTIKKENEELIIPAEEKDNAFGSMKMDVDRPVLQTTTKENSREDTSNASCNSCTFFNDVATTDTQSWSACSGDFQSAITPPRYSSQNEIGQETVARMETLKKPRRKRAGDISEIEMAEEQITAKRSSKNTSNSSSAKYSTGSKITSTDRGPRVKKGDRFLSCEFCRKEFTHAGDLKKHRRIHTGEKPYECDECQRKFAHASNLARHSRVHSGERPFVCNLCGRAFTRRDKLDIHTNSGRCEIIEKPY